MTQQRVGQAISLGLSRLVSLQREDGSWPGPNFAGPQFTAQWLITKRHFGMLEESDAEAMTAWMLGRQRLDGGFAASSDLARSSFPTSVLVRFALEDDRVDPDRLARLDRYIEESGGIEAADPATNMFGCLAGHVRPASLGRWSLFSLLIPGIHRAMGRRFSAAVGLSLVGFPCIVQSLQAGEPLGKGFHPIRKIEWRRAREYFLSHQNPTGDWRGVLNSTLVGCLALEALGVERQDPSLAKAIDYLDHFKTDDPKSGGLQVVPFTAEVWNTASAVKTLLGARELEGVDHRTYDENIHRGIDYLLTQQSDGNPLDWLNPAPGAPCDGGWAYEDQDPMGSDSDTTATVIEALVMAKEAGLRTDVDEPVTRGTRFLDGMQNESGGWPAFTHGLREKPPGPAFQTRIEIQKPTLWSATKMFLRPPIELGDSACADVTGRVLALIREKNHTG